MFHSYSTCISSDNRIKMLHFLHKGYTEWFFILIFSLSILDDSIHWVWIYESTKILIEFEWNLSASLKKKHRNSLILKIYFVELIWTRKSISQEHCTNLKTKIKKTRNEINVLRQLLDSHIYFHSHIIKSSYYAFVLY